MRSQHQRTIIRNAAKAILLAAQTACGERVFASRARKLWPHEFPAMLVYTLTEDCSGHDSAPREVKRSLSLVIQIAIEGDTERTPENEGEALADEQLDTICKQVEDALAADDTLNGTVSDCMLMRTDIQLVEDGDDVTLAAIMTWTVEYYTYMPEYVELDAFETQHQDWDIATEETTGEPAADGEVDADNTNELPQ